MKTKSYDSQIKLPSSPLPFTTLQNVLFLCLFLSFRCVVRSVIPPTQILVASKLYPISSAAFSSGDFSGVRFACLSVLVSSKPKQAANVFTLSVNFPLSLVWPTSLCGRVSRAVNVLTGVSHACTDIPGCETGGVGRNKSVSKIVSVFASLAWISCSDDSFFCWNSSALFLSRFSWLGGLRLWLNGG